MTRRDLRRVAAVLASSVFILNTAFAAERTFLRPNQLSQNLFIELSILFGCIFILAAGIGMLRFPDAYTRAHASSKLVTLGGASIFLGAGIAFFPLGAGGRLLLTAIFFLLTAPLASYMVSRAAYLNGIRPHQESGSTDEWDAAASETHDTD